MTRLRPWAWGLALALGCGPGSGTGEGGTADESSSGTSGTSGAMTTSTTITTSATTAATSAGTSAGSASEDSASSADGTTAITTLDTSGEDTCPPGGESCLCDIGSTCDEGLECVDGVCVPPPVCDQPEGEPNDDEGSAVVLDPAMCGAEAAMTDAALFGEETDWFVFETMAAQFCFSNPHATVTVDAIDVEVCIYAVCPEAGNPQVNCGFMSGLMDSMSPDGQLGCCGTGMATWQYAVCDFMQTPPASVEVSVTGGNADECIAYQLEWAY